MHDKLACSRVRRPSLTSLRAIAVRYRNYSIDLNKVVLQGSHDVEIARTRSAERSALRQRLVIERFDSIFGASSRLRDNDINSDFNLTFRASRPEGVNSILYINENKFARYYNRGRGEIEIQLYRGKKREMKISKIKNLESTIVYYYYIIIVSSCFMKLYIKSGDKHFRI